MISQTARLITVNNATVAGAAGMTLISDGMAVARVRRPGQTTLAIALCALMVLSLAKAMMLLAMGEAFYSAGIAALQAGSVVDHAAASLMQLDAVTTAFVRLLT